MYTRVAACHLRRLQVLLGQFARPTQCLAVWDYLGNHSPLVRGSSRNWLWVQQECLSSTRSGAIAPSREDSVARHDPAGEMRQIMEGRTLGRHDDTGKERIFRVHMSAPFNSRDHRHAYIRDILDNLNPFIVSLAPDARIGNIAERSKIDTRNELSACSCQDHDLIGAVLRDAVESIDKFRVILRRESERRAV